MAINQLSKFDDLRNNVSRLHGACKSYTDASKIDKNSLRRIIDTIVDAGDKALGAYNALLTELTTEEFKALVEWRVKPAPAGVETLGPAIDALRANVLAQYTLAFDGNALEWDDATRTHSDAPATPHAGLASAIGAMQSALAPLIL